MHTLSLTINGQHHTLQVQARTLLVELLRESLHLTGTHVGCDTSQCGCCTVLMDGEAIKSCSVLAVQAQGSHITTIEGMAQGPQLHPIQAAFSHCHGLQCGFCTPGMIMATAGLLQHTPQPTEEQIVEGLSGNLCRCTGYINIVQSVQLAVKVMQESST